MEFENEFIPIYRAYESKELERIAKWNERAECSHDCEEPDCPYIHAIKWPVARSA